MKVILTIAATAAFAWLIGCKGNNPPADTKAGSVASGNTMIVDVRTTEEWDNDGHAPCTVNYPLDKLETMIDSLRRYDKIEVVCRSGKRAEQAREILTKAGLANVENKGSWTSVQCP